MRIKLIAVGSKMPAWVEQGYQEYQKRLPPELKLELAAISLISRSKGVDVKRAIEKESSQMLAAIGKNDHVVALDPGGKPWSTEQLSEQLIQWQMLGENVSLLVGGPEGLSRECLQRAQQKWSLSNLTYPHPLVRVIVAEQLYRAWTILKNHPYHK